MKIKKYTSISYIPINCSLVFQYKQNNLIYELDGDGNMVPLPPTLPTANNPSKSTSSTNPLLLPQVQQAMSAHLQSTTHEWATTDLLESISRNHPKLAAGLNNPKYTAALQSMQTHPKETMEKLKKEQHSDILEFIQEFCGVMGEHFVQLGESKENKKEKEKHTKQQKYSCLEQNGGMNNDESAKIKEMGPLEEKAMREHRDQKNKANTNETKSKESNKHGGIDDDQVAAILSNDELRLILMDPKMQHVMEECTQTSSGGGHGRGLRYYMSHEEYGPKLRKLMDAGLLRMA